MIKKIIVLLFICSPLFGATYYIDPGSSDIVGDGSYETPWATLEKAFSEMDGGDSVVMKDGIYTGTKNNIAFNYQQPPRGSSTAWTTISAEHTGMAIFGNSWVDMYYDTPTSAYVAFDGLFFSSGTVSLRNVQHFKFLNCGSSYGGTGNSANFVAGRNCRFGLFEGCYAFGTGRTKFSVYQSSNVIVRNCVGRSDWHDANNEPFYPFGLYSTVNCESQNNLMIDNDQYSMYRNVEYGFSGFSTPSTDMDASSNTYTNCVAINNSVQSLGTTGNEYHAAYATTFRNCVFWDSRYASNVLRGVNDNIFNCTFGVFRSTTVGNDILLSYDGVGYNNNTSIKNSVIFDMQNQNAMNDVEVENYNLFYGNTCNFTGMPSSPGANDLLTTDPIYRSTNTSGGIKHVVRIENSSNLDGAGEGGLNIGANQLYIFGSTGTLWGETGYNSTTTIPMWPFKNEALFKHKMRQYYYSDSTGTVTGNRGFAQATTQIDTNKQRTLTSYIWEYLGNQKPSDLYQSSTTITANAVNISTGQSVSLNCKINPSTATASQYYWDFGDSSYTVTYTSYTTHIYPSSGTYYVSASADGTSGSTDPGILALTVSNWAVNQDTTATISANVTSGAYPLDVQFTCSFTGPTSMKAYSLNFGDSSGEVNASPNNPLVRSHTYTSAGTYNAYITYTLQNDSTITSDNVTITVTQSENPKVLITGPLSITGLVLIRM